MDAKHFLQNVSSVPTMTFFGRNIWIFKNINIKIKTIVAFDEI
jgi:hypothetical protein